MTRMFSPAGIMSWKLASARPVPARRAGASAPVLDDRPIVLDDDRAIDQPPALRLATQTEVAASAALQDLARRCGVGEAFAPLLAVLDSAVGAHIDLVIANGLLDTPALIAVDRSGVSVVDPSLAIPGERGQVLALPFSSINKAQLVKGAVGGRRARWLVLDAQSPLRLELSKDAWEAASQVVYVINQRVEASRRRARRKAAEAPHAVAG